MDDFISHVITVFFGFFAIMNPLANTAVFVGLTGDLEEKQKVRIAKKSLFLTFTIIFLFAALGKTLFTFFGITLPALRITGGILVFIIGYHMLQGESSPLHSTDKSADSLAISPLAVPILAGPGTIATAMSFSASGSWFEVTSTLLIFLVLCTITYICFIFGERIVNRLGENTLHIITRLMGLILSVIGVQMLVNGIYGAISSFQICSMLPSLLTPLL